MNWRDLNYSPNANVTTDTTFFFSFLIRRLRDFSHFVSKFISLIHHIDVELIVTSVINEVAMFSTFPAISINKMQYRISIT